MMNSTNKKILLTILVLAVLIGGALYLSGRKGNPSPSASPSPSPSSESSAWKTQTTGGVVFQYPEKLSTKYISTQDWPPQAEVLNEPFSCTEAGLEMARAGQTAKRMVDGRAYCVTTVAEGAAGSIYTQYAYAFPKDGKTVVLTFTLRAVQCGNFDEPEKTECQGERETFDLDGVVDRIAKTSVFTKE